MQKAVGKLGRIVGKNAKGSWQKAVGKQLTKSKINRKLKKDKL